MTRSQDSISKRRKEEKNKSAQTGERIKVWNIHEIKTWQHTTFFTFTAAFLLHELKFCISFSIYDYYALFLSLPISLYILYYCCEQFVSLSQSLERESMCKARLGRSIFKFNCCSVQHLATCIQLTISRNEMLSLSFVFIFLTEILVIKGI